MGRCLGLIAGLVFCLCMPGGSANAGEAKEIILKDGSRIRGEVVSMQNGLYQVKTESLGLIQLRSPQIESITSFDSSPSQTVNDTNSVGPTMSPSALQSIQSSMVSNPGVMSSISELQNDPQMKAVLDDPEIMRAVQNFDLQALSDNPKIKALMNNAKIKRIQRSVN